jgi:hypothetical protein
MGHKATNEQLAVIIAESISFSEAMRKCDMKPRGASYQWFQKRVKKLGLDTSHFKGYSAGGLERAKQIKKHWSEILVLGDGSGRERSEPLRRAFKEYCLEQAVPHICNVCNVCKMEPIWNGQPMIFQIDHINSINFDNRPLNLQWICGNCHQQKNSNGY